jgi:hypothetical protein
MFILIVATLSITEQTMRASRMPARRKIMKHKNVTIPRLLILVLLFAGFADLAATANQGVLIAMGGDNGTPEIYEKWKSLGGRQNARVVLIPTADNLGDDFAPVVKGLNKSSAFKRRRYWTQKTTRKRTQPRSWRQASYLCIY